MSLILIGSKKSIVLALGDVILTASVLASCLVDLFQNKIVSHLELQSTNNQEKDDVDEARDTPSTRYAYLSSSKARSYSLEQVID